MRLNVWPVAVVAALALALAPAAAARHHAPRAYTGFSKRFSVRPSEISYRGDGRAILGGILRSRRHVFGRLHWTRWRRTSAFATGRDWIDGCRPNCAEGTFHPHRARVLLTRVRRGHYTRMRIRYRRHGHWVTVRRKLVATPHGYHDWAPSH